MKKMTTRTFKLNAYQNSTFQVKPNLRTGGSTPNFRYPRALKLLVNLFYQFNLYLSI